jgi:hypothetical protein
MIIEHMMSKPRSALGRLIAGTSSPPRHGPSIDPLAMHNGAVSKARSCFVTDRTRV